MAVMRGEKESAPFSSLPDKSRVNWGGNRSRRNRKNKKNTRRSDRKH